MGKFDRPTFPTNDQGSSKKQPPQIGEKVKAKILPEDTLPEEVGENFIAAGKRGRGQSHVLSPEDSAEETRRILDEVERIRQEKIKLTGKKWDPGIESKANKN